MYNVGEKFVIKVNALDFAEIIGVYPSGQGQKLSSYEISYAGLKFRLSEDILDSLFESDSIKKLKADIEEKFLRSINPIASSDEEFHGENEDPTIKESLQVQETEKRGPGRPKRVENA